jgi:hypothetical protein
MIATPKMMNETVLREKSISTAHLTSINTLTGKQMMLVINEGIYFLMYKLCPIWITKWPVKDSIKAYHKAYNISPGKKYAKRLIPKKGINSSYTANANPSVLNPL